MTKVCSKCGEEKELSEFYAHQTNKDGRTGSCKVCHNRRGAAWQAANGDKRRSRYKAVRDENPEEYKNRSAEYRAANKERIAAQGRKSRLLVNYGITVEEYDTMYQRQDGKCMICGKSPENTLCVDHCHTTGKVRGLLCGTCNRGIGLLQDDPKLCLAAAKYLKDTTP